MKTFKEFIDEGKQVGLIHHFTKFDNLKNMIEQEVPFRLFSRNNENVSFTRNRVLQTMNHHFRDNDVRITVDGTALSNKYKIEPLAGLPDHAMGSTDFSNKNRVPRHKGEAEEAIINHPVDILPYIRKIHILSNSKTADAYHKNIKPALDKMKIPHDYIRGWSMTDLKENYDEDYLFHSYDLHWEINIA